MNERVLLDVTRAATRRWQGRAPSGLDRVADAYVAHFADNALAVVQVRGRALVLDSASSRNLFMALEQPRPEFRSLVLSLMWRLPRIAASSSEFEGARYINVSHTDFDLSAHWRWVRRHRLRATYFVHDLIPIDSPQVTTRHKSGRHLGRVSRALSGAEGIIVNSHATARALKSFAERAGTRVPQTLVAPPASVLATDPSVEVATTSTMFVAVGTIEKRKNYPLLLDVWSRLIGRMGDATPKLVIVGSWGLGGVEIRHRLMRDAELSRFVEVRSGLADAEVAGLVCASRAVLLPSLAEGFGLPLVEALQLGVPVIASSLPSFAEIGQGIPTLLDPADRSAWEEAVADFCGDSPERTRQLALMDKFTSTSWADHFIAVERWLASPAQAEPCVGRDNDIYTPGIRAGRQGREVQC